MRDELLYFYERELAYLRRIGAEFAKRYPKVAARLLLEPNKCDDPHVERLLEGFAFLAARVHLRIEDDFPEISEALLSVIYPHAVRPVPSMSLVEFHLDREQGKLTSGLRIPRDTLLYSRPVGGVPCKFRTCYDTTLWPLEVAAAKWVAPYELQPPVRTSEATAALSVELRCFPDITFASLELSTLRFYLGGDAGVNATLYELLCNNCVRILLRDATPGASRDPVELPPSALRPAGFAEEESMLPPDGRSFHGYDLLREYFTFPEKFYFLDLSGFERARAAGFGDRLEIVFLIAPFQRPERRQLLEIGVSRDAIRLGCTPIVNLFPQTAEPILLTERRHEYLVVPDARRRESTWIFSIEDVVAVTPGSTEPIRFEPLYSYRHGGGDSTGGAYWYASRRPAGWRRDEGTDLYLSFVDLTGRTVYPEQDAVTVRLLCHNGSLPSRLPFGDGAGDFEMQGGGPIDRITTLVRPTPYIEPPLGKPQLWRVISQLSLNYTSLMDGDGETLRELLRLHNVAESASGEKQIQGIVGVRGSPTYAMIESEHGLTFVRGNRLEIEMDEEPFAGSSAYLLANVLDHFLGQYVSLNSFISLVVRTRQRKEILREWPPRTGNRTLV